VAALPSSAAPNLNLPSGMIKLAGDTLVRDNVPYVWHKPAKSRAKTAPTDPHLGQTPTAPPPSLVPCECQETQRLSSWVAVPHRPPLTAPSLLPSPAFCGTAARYRAVACWLCHGMGRRPSRLWHARG
jgi:hypothetical protein